MNVERNKVMIITEILLFFSLFNIFSFNPPLFVRLKREPISYETTPDEIKEQLSLIYIKKRKKKKNSTQLDEIKATNTCL